ncbi:hypothetical protein AB0M57_04490 [Streptomyces sp. NPDC051597]|uniref:hypothetical protein n=1 Tax=Streptomyces sp. NPDC051597 TaxID=3155049 RepID=UPI00343232C9
MADGEPGIVTDALTLDELRDRIEAALRAVPIRLGPNALAQLERGQPVRLSGGEYAAMALEAAHDLINDDRTEGDRRA